MKTFLISVLVLLVTACAGIVKPVTINDKLVYAANLADSVAVSTMQLYQRGDISKERAAMIAEQLDNVNLILTNARIANGISDFKSAQSYLDAANQILLNLEKQLKGVVDGQSKPAKTSFWSDFRNSSPNQYFVLSANSI